jgi:hypothetical protein
VTRTCIILRREDGALVEDTFDVTISHRDIFCLVGAQPEWRSKIHSDTAQALSGKTDCTVVALSLWQ